MRRLLPEAQVHPAIRAAVSGHHADVVAAAEAAIAAHPVVVFGMAGNPFVRKARRLLDTAGVPRVMMGTDYPFPLGEQVPGAGIAALGLTESEQARLYHGTALEWLGLPASRFE